MHHFDYKNGALHAEDVAINALADKIGTPFYCYSASTIRRHIQVFLRLLVVWIFLYVTRLRQILIKQFYAYSLMKAQAWMLFLAEN